MSECCQYSRTGDGHGRWRCDECGTDMGAQEGSDRPIPGPLLTEAAGPVRCRDCGTTIERGDPCVDMRDQTGDVLCQTCGDERNPAMKTLTEIIAQHRFLGWHGIPDDPADDEAPTTAHPLCVCGWDGYETGDGDWPVHVAAAWRAERTITVDQLASLPDGTWIRDGMRDVGVKQDWPLDLAVKYGARGDKINARIPEPIYVLYVPGEEQ